MTAKSLVSFTHKRICCGLPVQKRHCDRNVLAAVHQEEHYSLSSLSWVAVLAGLGMYDFAIFIGVSASVIAATIMYLAVALHFIEKKHLRR